MSRTNLQQAQEIPAIPSPQQTLSESSILSVDVVPDTQGSPNSDSTDRLPKLIGLPKNIAGDVGPVAPVTDADISAITAGDVGPPGTPLTDTGLSASTARDVVSVANTHLPENVAGNVCLVTPVTSAGIAGDVAPVTDTVYEPIPKCTELVANATVSETTKTPLQIKTEGISTAGPTVTSSEQQQHTTAASLIVTGTGSITATPTAYTTAVTTIASSTTTTTSELGKRIRKTSTKYEDYESQVPQVSIQCVRELRHTSCSFSLRSYTQVVANLKAG